MFGGKPLSWYWPSVKFPVLISSGWLVLGLIISLVAWQSYIDIFTFPGLAIIVSWGSFLLAGYMLFMHQKKATGGQAAWAGAITGVIAGLVGLIVFFVMMSETQFLEWSVQQALAQLADSGQSVDPDMLMSMTKLMSTIGAFLSPVINGLLGALFGWFGSLIAKKIEK